MYYLGVVSLLFLLCVSLEIIFKEHLFDSIKERFIWIALCLVVGISWDMYSMPRLHWVFSGKGILGIYLNGIIPIEELLWFLIVPYFFITIYETIKIVLYKK